MVKWGKVLIVLLVLGASLYLGAYGVGLKGIIALGLLLSIYFRTKTIEADLQAIKKHLGILEGERPVSNEEIEAELEREMRAEADGKKE
ncbi:hypothetical protein [Paenibacillus tengchongensis]|uniref:hypothetical protein n=1 Tax=Paenibacillus tengchongensis TaxID=2608684 RepID=UPI00124F6DB4|nr:hypothetical protein [Paenibacillus tengchongensis]